MALFNGKNFTQYTNLNVTEEFRFKGSPISLTNRVTVNSSFQLAGTLDSDTEYFIDGIIDMSGVEVEVPAGGLYLAGYNFDLSQLVCADDNYTMFTSVAGGSGNVLFRDLAIEVSGSNSQVYDLTALSGFEAIELARVNYNNCSSLGEIDNYRQGLEDGTGRFGGTPTLTLSNVWLGGFRISTSITRSLDPAMSDPLFAAGPGFVMNSRFATDMNLDLGSTASFFDFAPANFANPSTVQLDNCIVTRNGVINVEDATIIPNMSQNDLVARWRTNIGIPNTFEGGRQTVTSEAETVINTIDVYEDVAGTFTADELVHFDVPANGQLRNLGDNPVEYIIDFNLTVEGTANNVFVIKPQKWDDSMSFFVDLQETTRVINSLVGARDVGFVASTIKVELDQNDFVKFQIKNQTSTDNLTVENDSYYIVEAR